MVDCFVAWLGWWVNFSFWINDLLNTVKQKMTNHDFLNGQFSYKIVLSLIRHSITYPNVLSIKVFLE